MRRESPRPNVNRVLASLKGFQRATAEYAFDRLYTAPDSTRRFLVADEVGLGKTLVARGVIAKAIDHLWEDIDRIDIVYICSNSQIARQNVNRLRLSDDQKFVTADRLTMLPTAIKNLKKNKVNFLAFTPGTSFDLKSSMGRREERVLLYWMVERVWPRGDTGPKNLFQGDVKNTERFRRRLRKFAQTASIDRSLAAAFKKRLRQVGKSTGWGGEGLRKEYYELCDRFRYARKHIPKKDRQERAALIGRLRALLAETCVRALEPDLVILDEFQRFKQLLDGEDDAALLASQLFNYSDAKAEVRLLLLSATPYKMYTLQHEAQEDDHYQDFLRTVEFLDPSLKGDGRFRQTLADYRRHLYRLGDGGDTGKIHETKNQIEDELRRVMARTERLRASEETGGMLREVPASGIELLPSDVSSYASLQSIGKEVGQGQVIEYWKSAPYLLNFMDDYKLKTKVLGRLEKGDDALDELLSEASGLLLSWEEIQAYQTLDPANARLRHFLAWLSELEAWRLLWLPPSLPYYQLEGAFLQAAEADISKRLVFSTWKVVPKAIASLVSYEMERRIFQEFEPGAINTPEERKKRKPLLRFTFSQGRLTGMPVLGILYPSPVLARLGDPLALRTEARGAQPEPTLGHLLALIQDRLAEPLAQVIRQYADEDREDEAWYWAAPILLDLRLDRARTSEWFEERQLAGLWSGEAGDEDDESRWAGHVDRAKALVHGELVLGKPPRDLSEVLSLLALGGPAVCALRALTRPYGIRSEASTIQARNAAAVVAWSFRSRFNLPEAMALIRTRAKSEDVPYWKQVLEYCAQGHLQAVLDEYVHLLRDLEGLFDSPREAAYKSLAEALSQAVSLRTGVPHLDDIHASGKNGRHRVEARQIRNHFCVRFGAQESDDGRAGAREDQVRRAFNSPFWPFVLTTTSVGQEGLDFHAYCHAVVHWNLPSNPVDLEQREGRVHRYKGHAVRKNVARACGEEALQRPSDDVWQRLFELARESSEDPDHGLVPYWLFPLIDGSFIERHVPALPLSRDIRQLEALRRSLAVYRMVFGQPRQDDLMAYLMERLSEEELAKLRPDLQIDLAPLSGGAGELKIR